jgi:hypothetical protein
MLFLETCDTGGFSTKVPIKQGILKTDLVHIYELEILAFYVCHFPL